MNVGLLEGNQVPKGAFNQIVSVDCWETCFYFDTWSSRIEKTAFGLQMRCLIGNIYMTWNPKDYSKEGKKNKNNEAEKPD